MRVAIFSGGGQKGQFHIGALRKMVNTGTRYDCFSGISFGALLASFCAQYDIGDQPKMVDDMCSSFDIETKDVWKHWKPFGPVHGLWKSGMLNSKPLAKMCHRVLSEDKIRGSDTKAFVYATNVSTGELVEFTDQSKHIVDATIASASFPAAFGTHKVNGVTYCDGAVRSTTPVTQMIKRGATSIDVYLCHAIRPDSLEELPSNAIKMGLRSLELMYGEMVWKDLVSIDLMNRLIKSGKCSDETKRIIDFRIIAPVEDFDINPLSFTKKTTKELRLLGKIAAMAVAFQA